MELFHRPGRVAVEQFVPGARALFGGFGHLGFDQRLVGGFFDPADHPDGSGETGLAEGREHLRVERARVIRLVDEDALGAGIDHLGGESIEADAFGFVFAEKQGFAFFQDEHLVVAVFLAVDRIPCGIVEDHAVLEDFDE